MDKVRRLEELKAKKKWVLSKIERAKKRLGHPHGQWQSVHDVAESDFKLFSALLDGIEREIEKLEKEGP